MEELKRMLEYTGINVEDLVNNYTEELHRRSHPEATTEGSIMALKEWATKKDFLIHQIMKMPGYNGNLQAVVSIEVPFKRSSWDVETAVKRVWGTLFKDGEKLMSRLNEEGKTIEDLIKEELTNLPALVSVSSLPTQGGKESKSFTEFNSEGYTKKSIENRYNVKAAINILQNYNSARLEDDTADALNKLIPNLDAKAGMKTTRTLGKIIKLNGLEDKTKGSMYGRVFISDYCELMREGGARYTFVISIHPIDFLTMSIGEFTSCHDITRGHWQSGCIAYMLDNVAMITYAIKNNQTVTLPQTGEVVPATEHPEYASKVYRNVFFWDDKHRLIQSRVYPKSNDGCGDVLSAFRHKVQEEISLANGWNPSTWTHRKRKFTEFTSHGNGATNYPDWQYSNMGGNLSTPNHANEEYSTDQIVIGAKPMCIVCGRRHTTTYSLTCGGRH